MTRADLVTWLPTAAGAATLAAAMLILLVRRRAPRRPVVLLLAAAGTGLAAAILHLAAGGNGLVDRLWALGLLVLLPAGVTLFPDGRPPPGLGWTPVVVIALAGGLALVHPGPYSKTGLGALIAYLLVLATQWWRFEHTDPPGRQALAWLALGALPGSLLAAVISFAFSYEVFAAVDLTLWCLFVLCLAIGLAAPDVRDIRVLIISAGVHTVTALLVVAVYSLVLAGTEAVAGRPVTLPPGTLGLIAAALAVAYAPLSRFFRQVVEVLLFGPRSDPLQAASRAGEQLSDDPLPALRSLRESLALPYAALVDGAGEVVAASGRPGETTIRRPLSASDDWAGFLEIGLPPGRRTLPAGDEQVVAVLAPALAQLIRAQRLRAEVQASRAAVVTAVEEERRRLRRDLHDGLGPRLTGVAYATDAARNLLGRDPERASELLTGVRAEAGEAIAEVRRLVDGLRPPSLDQVGLEQTIRQHARRLLRPDGRPLTVELRVPEPLAPLSAAVEVTAYRIVVEALTNAARHSGGDTVVITLALAGPELAIEVRDDGPGRGGWTPGHGLTSMRERAEMLGGTVSAGAGRVAATLPAA